MSLPLWSIVVAAGAGRRLGAETPKQYLALAGEPLLVRALRPFAHWADPGRLVLVVPPGDEDEARALVTSALPTPPRIVSGGRTRQESVWLGLQAITDDHGFVAVHDAARPLFDGALLPGWWQRLEGLGERGALVPVLPVADTVLTLDGEEASGLVDRSRLARVQTPQLFALPLLRRAHREAQARGETDASDDGSLVVALGETLLTVPGDPGNFKITTAGDLARAEAILAARGEEGATSATTRTGFGYDSHRFAPERLLILGGVEIPSDAGLSGHSDADVLTHAIMDALLGAAALGDIGRHFPDDDERWRGARSLDLLARVLALLVEHGLAPAHVDATLIAERPRLAPHFDAIRASLAAALGLPASSVSVKATSNEGMGAIGRGEGMAALAVATLTERRP